MGQTQSQILNANYFFYPFVNDFKKFEFKGNVKEAPMTLRQEIENQKRLYPERLRNIKAGEPIYVALPFIAWGREPEIIVKCITNKKAMDLLNDTIKVKDRSVHKSIEMTNLYRGRHMSGDIPV